MNHLRQVQRGLDYIEAHLSEDLEPGDIAREAGISRWHFQRIFKALTNETLKTYIRSRRFADALEALTTTDARIIEIALAAGFDTQESFTRAFKTAFDATPADYRKRKNQFPTIRKVRFDADYLRHLHQGVSLEPELCAQPAIELIGMQTNFFSVDSEKNNIASRIPALWAAFLPRLREVPETVQGLCYGIIRQTPEKTDELEYLAGIEVAPGAKVPSGMTRLKIEPTLYAKFAHRGAVARLDQTVNYIYSSWLARSGMRHTYGADIEFYGSQYHPDSEQSVISYAVPVEPRP